MASKKYNPRVVIKKNGKRDIVDANTNNSIEKLHVFLNMKKLTGYLLSVCPKFSRAYKYNLGERILDKALDTIDLIQDANININNREMRMEVLTRCLEIFNSMKTLIDYAFDLHQISSNQYGVIIGHTEIIGKQLKSWRETTRDAIYRHKRREANMLLKEMEDRNERRLKLLEGARTPELKETEDEGVSEVEAVYEDRPDDF